MLYSIYNCLAHIFESPEMNFLDVLCIYVFAADEENLLNKIPRRAEEFISPPFK